MSEIIKHYVNRQQDFSHRYIMKFCRETGDIISIWCIQHPPDPHHKGVSHHHLHSDGRLCQRSGYESRSLEHAEAFAYWWMKRWSIYVRSGDFPMTSESVNIPD